MQRTRVMLNVVALSIVGGAVAVCAVACGGEPRAQSPATGTSPEPSLADPTYQIVFQTDRDGGSEVYIMNADGTGVTNLTNNAANAYNDRHPTGSPDGSKIAFRSDRDGNPDVYVMNVDGSNQIRLTNDTAADGNPRWSPSIDR